MKEDSTCELFPRSRSIAINAFSIASYSYFSTRVINAIFSVWNPAGAAATSPLVRGGNDWMSLFDLFLLSPCVESLILIGAIEGARKLWVPKFFAILVGTAVLMGWHAIQSFVFAIVVAPLFLWSAAYYSTREISRASAAFGVIFIHILYNTPATVTVAGLMIKGSLPWN